MRFAHRVARHLDQAADRIRERWPARHAVDAVWWPGIWCATCTCGYGQFHPFKMGAVERIREHAEEENR